MPLDTTSASSPVPLDHCMRWHGLSVRVCECMELCCDCPVEARRVLPKLSLAQIEEALARDPLHPDRPAAAPGGAFQRAAGSVKPVKQASGFTGDWCSACGQFSMVRTGTCLTCQICGDTSGGCS